MGDDLPPIGEIDEVDGEKELNDIIISPENVLSHPIIVYKESLLIFAELIKTKGYRICHVEDFRRAEKYNGSALTLKWLCLYGHEYYSWDSQPKYCDRL